MVAVGLAEGVCRLQGVGRRRQVGEVDLSCVVVGVTQRLDEDTGIVLPRHQAQSAEVIVPEYRRNDDPRLHAGNELSVHHDARSLPFPSSNGCTSATRNIMYTARSKAVSSSETRSHPARRVPATNPGKTNTESPARLTASLKNPGRLSGRPPRMVACLDRSN